MDIYKITRQFPKEERYGLISQIRRSAVSEPSNVEKIIRKKPLDPLNPRLLEPSSPTNIEKSLKYKQKRINRNIFMETAINWSIHYESTRVH
ncbi:four helix bundle protein [Thermodesulfobacteriota bacterium]